MRADDNSLKPKKFWRVIASKSVVRDRWIDLRADDCIDARGVEINPFYVLTYKDWAQVVAITPDNQLVLVRQYRHGAAMVTRELPSGVVDPSDATPIAAGARELLEETGYACETYRLVGEMFNNPASCTNRIHVILGEGAQKIARQDLDATEDIDVELVNLDEAMRLARNGEIHHSAQIASLYLAIAARNDSERRQPQAEKMETDEL